MMGDVSILRTHDLSTWLLEQIAEDERQAQAVPAVYADPVIWCVSEEDETGSPRQWLFNHILIPDSMPEPVADHIAVWNPARVLAECEAKRRRVEYLVDRLESWRVGFHDSGDREAAIDDLELMFKLEALPYADLPGYREEWAV